MTSKSPASTTFFIGFHLLTLAEGLISYYDHQVLHCIFKPITMLTLMTFYWKKSRKYQNSLVTLMNVGFFFGFIANIAFMFDNYLISYIIAVGAFTVAYIIDAIAVFKYFRAQNWPPNEIKLFLFFLPYWAYVPVISFIMLKGVTSTMAIMGTLKDHTTKESYWRIVVGSVLLLISDILNVVQRVTGLEGAFLNSVLIITYFLGHYMIAVGYLMHLETYSIEGKKDK